MFWCLRPGCPRHCGTRRHPGCADRMMYRALFLLLTFALLVSLGMGLKWLDGAAGSRPVPESPPLGSPQILELVGEA